MVDGNIWTWAGTTVGVDQGLAIEWVDLDPVSDRTQEALTFARSTFKADLTAAMLAVVAHLSPR